MFLVAEGHFLPLPFAIFIADALYFRVKNFKCSYVNKESYKDLHDIT